MLNSFFETIVHRSKKNWSLIILLDILKVYWLTIIFSFVLLLITSYAFLISYTDISNYDPINLLPYAIVLCFIYVNIPTFIIFLQKRNMLWYTWLKQATILFLVLVLLYFTPEIVHFLPWIGSLNTYPVNAQCLITTLIQSEAAIIAIVITLSLVAVQYSSSTYSPKMIEIFRKKPDLWLILSFYIVLIVYGLFVLKTIDFLNNSNPISSLDENHLLRLLVGSILAFFYLAIYTRCILKFLEPLSIVKWIILEINPHEIQKAISGGSSYYGIDGPIQRFTDVLTISIGRHDTSTVLSGVIAFGNSFRYKINHNYFSKDEIRSIQELLLYHYDKLVYSCILSGGYESFIVIKVQIGQIARYAIENKDAQLFSDILSSLRGFTNETISLNKNRFLGILLEFFTTISSYAIEDDFSDVYSELIDFLDSFGTNIFINNMGEYLPYITTSLFGLGQIVIEDENESGTKKLISSLKNMGVLALKENNKDIVIDVESKLQLLLESFKDELFKEKSGILQELADFNNTISGKI